MTIALVDCNNFFVSCERVFRPDLRKHPTMVVSGNDALIIARSNEVKELGIPMASPVYKYKALIKKHKIKLFSANFALYTEFSARIMSLLRKRFKNIEVYSIDEAFVEFGNCSLTEAQKAASEIPLFLSKNLGIPVTVGVAPSKTLAKLACEYGKKLKKDYWVITKNNLRQILHNSRIEKVWGIGARTSFELNKSGVNTAYELCCSPNEWIHKRFSISLLRTSQELRGKVCFALKSYPEAQKSLESSRSFGRLVNKKEELKQALNEFVGIGAHKLKQQRLNCSKIQVFLTTKEDFFTYELQLIDGSNSKQVILNAVYEGLNKLYQAEKWYKKAGIRLLNLSSTNYIQLNILDNYQADQDQIRLEKSIEKINQKWGDNTIQEANMLGEKSWRNIAKYKSPSYLSEWKEIPKVGKALSG